MAAIPHLRHELPNLSVALLLFDGTDVSGASVGAARLLGLPREDLAGISFDDLFDEQDLERLRRSLGSVTAEHPATVDLRLRVEPGRIVRLELELLTGSEVLGHLSDVTDEVRLNFTIGVNVGGVLILDQDLVITWVTARSSEVLVISREDLTGRPIFDFIHPDDVAKFQQFANSLRAAIGQTRPITVRGHPPGTETYWPLAIELTYLPDEEAVGGYVFKWGFATEGTGDEDGSAEDSTRALVMSVTEANPTGIISADLTGKTHFRNSMSRVLLGDDIDGDNAANFVAAARPEHQGPLQEAIDIAARGDERGSALAAFDRSDGSTLWLRIDTIPLLQQNGEPGGWVTSMLDVTGENVALEALQRAQVELWHLANHDALTDLPNRALFMDRLRLACARHDRYHQGAALLFCDLDGFKTINDTLGHRAGDDVLREAAARLERSVRQTDTVARMGGDEFVVLCEGYGDDAHLDLIVSRVQAAFSAPFTLGDVAAHVGISIGVAIAPTSAISPDALLAAADRAMYAMKRDARFTAVATEP